VEQERRSFYRYRAVWLGLAILFVILLVLLAAPRSHVAAPIAVIFPPPGSGRIAHVNSKAFFVALVTNTSSGKVALETMPMLLDEHRMAIAVIGSWGGTTFQCNLGPGQVVALPVVSNLNCSVCEAN
jgi:hypothetical protein